MPAIETLGATNLVAGTTYGACGMAAGDSNVVRPFPDSQFARLVALNYDADLVHPFRVRSPLLYDDVQGIRIMPGQTPSQRVLPAESGQNLNKQDTLTFEATTTAAVGVATIAPTIFYSQLPGAAARLYNPSDILPLVKNIKPVVVTFGIGANTPPDWADLVITTTEDLLHANRDHALLGITVDNAVAAVAIRGVETGNLRIGVPGVLDSDLTANYFVMLSELTGLPCIPVINSANKNNTYASLISSAALAAACNVQLIFAELAQNLA